MSLQTKNEIIQAFVGHVFIY